jgi:hypothetical protein
MRSDVAVLRSTTLRRRSGEPWLVVYKCCLVLTFVELDGVPEPSFSGPVGC